MVDHKLIYVDIIYFHQKLCHKPTVLVFFLDFSIWAKTAKSKSYNVLDSFHMRDIHIIGRRNHMLQLLASQQIQSDKIRLKQSTINIVVMIQFVKG